MSAAAKFDCASYKPFEPDYHPQRPIIIGEEGLDSPETVTLKYEEAVARANGDLRGESPPEGLLPMSHYGKPQTAPIHGYDATRDYQDAGYQPYGAQGYTGGQHDNATPLSAAQLNQEAFAANSAVGQYLPVGQPVVSCHPSSGLAGTKVSVKVSSQDDPLALSSPVPIVYLVFGTHKMLAENLKNVRDNTGCVVTFTAEAPDLLITGAQGPNVPLMLLIEAAGGQEVSRTGAGRFVYHDVGLTGPGANPDDITRKAPKSPEQAQQSPRSVTTQMAYDSSTNTYDFATAPSQQQQQAPSQSPYGQAFPQDNSGNMLSAYRTASFTEHHYPRAVPPPLRPPMAAWQQQQQQHHHQHHQHHHPYSRTPGHQIARPSLTPLPMPTPTTPTLVRTTSLQTSPGSGQGSGFPSWGSSSYSSNKAILNIVGGKLDSMAENWTPEEWSNRRRIVMFNKKQTGSTLTTTFRAVNVNERPPNSVCISCIWWAEKNECFVTSVDTIYLLEQLVVAPNRFSVEEKNRIRRNLEGFRPQTVSKTKADSEEFFKIIMAFPNPKPRNIEKDVKVFPWKILESALKKIIGKYSASPSATLPPSQMLTPAPVSTYPSLPTPPAPASVASDPVNAYAVPSSSQLHHEGLTSPRSATGAHHNWAPPYSTGPTRPLSPVMAAGSPRQSSVRLSAPLPAVSSYDTRPVPAGSYGTSSGIHHSLLHQSTPPSAPSSGRWDSSTMPAAMPTPATYAEPYQPMAPHQGPNPHPQQHVYGSSGYGDGAQRA